jgi:type III pantothenate kinase
MLLCLDVGNTQIHGGVYEAGRLRTQFRKSTHPLGTADELGVFFSAVLRENGLDPRGVTRTAICSVVPAAVRALSEACVAYWKCEPFILQAGTRTGLKVRYRNAHEVGSDRIANAIAATHRHPRRNILVVDCGTATTFDVITSTGDYLGGAILPGVGVSLDALASHTARLPRVELARPAGALGRSTVESIQSGVFHGHVGAIRRLIALLALEAFADDKPRVIGTGGFAWLFEDEKVFDEIIPELVLDGLRHAESLNREPEPAGPGQGTPAG